MSNLSKDFLFVLIKSLSKSEKRQFNLYVNRLGVNTDAKFLSLFVLLDKMDDYNEEEIIRSKIVTKVQLSNLKANLYKQILVSLRLNPIHQNIRIQIREQLDFATILYQKGLYKQSLKILDKAKSMALDNEEKNIAYEIVELEKVIESQYITRSIATRADELCIQAKDLSKSNVIASKLSNLSLQLYGYLLKTGYAKSDEEMQTINQYFNDRMPEIIIEELGFREKLWLYKAHLWYSFLVQDFLGCFKYSSKWVDLFYENPNMISINPVWYIKGANYLLECLYLLKHKTYFNEALVKFEETVNSESFPKNDNVIALNLICLYNHKFNLHFLDGDFKGGLYLVDATLEQIKLVNNQIDEHHIMVFYYKIACLYFGTGDNKNCIIYLNKIINNKNLSMREDLMCFARVLNVVAHYDGNFDLDLENQLKSTYAFLIKMNELHEVQREMIKFLRKLGSIYPHELKDAFKHFLERLKVYENHPYEKRAFLYLDIISWLESKIENKPVAEIIQEKAKRTLR
jgi:tetratricopeptide (TPR) repeat protein